MKRFITVWFTIFLLLPIFLCYLNLNETWFKIPDDFPAKYVGKIDVSVENKGGVIVAEWLTSNFTMHSASFTDVLEFTVEKLTLDGGGVIYIKAGKYLIKNKHVIHRPETDWVYFAGALLYKPCNVAIVGEGKDTVLISDVGVTNPIYIYNAVNFTISNLVVDGQRRLQNRPYFDCYALIFNDGGGENVTYHDLQLRNAAYMGIYVGNNDFLLKVVEPGWHWYCPLKNVKVYNVLTVNCGTGVFLDHMFNGIAYNITSINDNTAIGFASLTWKHDDKMFENVTVIDPMDGVFKGWYPEGKLRNIYIYLSRPQNWHLFDFTNATEITLDGVYVYGKTNPNRELFYTNIPEAIKIVGTVFIDPDWKP